MFAIIGYVVVGYFALMILFGILGAIGGITREF